jgi:CheY-like chemotaxis protein
LKLAREAKPDAITLDVLMPKIDGWAVLRALKEEPKWASIPVVVVTAKSLSATDREFLDGRVKRLVQKGEEDLSNLLSVLNGALPTGHD